MTTTTTTKPTTDTAPINGTSWFSTTAESDLVKAARERLAARKAAEVAMGRRDSTSK